MFFRKTERKKSNMGAILTVGALAAVGVWTITKRGKAIVNTALYKLKNMWNNATDSVEQCDSQCE